MKQIKLYLRIIFSVSLLFVLSNCKQNKQTLVSTNPTIKEVAKEIMANTNTCALITVDSLNRPRVRMMGTLQPDEDFTVWFGTNSISRKVEQIQQNPEVTVYYTQEGNSGYVMLQGTAQLVNDDKVKEIHWREDWKQFYPHYPDDYLLIKVKPTWIEVVSYKYNITSESENWEPQKILFD